MIDSARRGLVLSEAPVVNRVPEVLTPPTLLTALSSASAAVPAAVSAWWYWDSSEEATALA
jgi:hypothetical protein